MDMTAGCALVLGMETRTRRNATLFTASRPFRADDTESRLQGLASNPCEDEQTAHLLAGFRQANRASDVEGEAALR
jgi:hypothetical protein